MPRKPRFFLPDVPSHIVQRGHDRQAVFFDKSDYQEYLTGLRAAAERYECSVHAYALMTNHVHLLVTPPTKEAIPLMMQYLGRHYVAYINYTYGRRGTLWEGRYKSSLIQDEFYLLGCYRYIELNPVRANMVKGPGQYHWSSYRFNALGRADDVISPHAEYLKLGRTRTSRRDAYKALFKTHMEPEQINAIHNAWQTGTPLGDDRFKQQVEIMLGRRVGQAVRGRPRKQTAV